MGEAWSVFLVREDVSRRLADACREAIAALGPIGIRGGPVESWTLVIGGDEQHAPPNPNTPDEARRLRIIPFGLRIASAGFGTHLDDAEHGFGAHLSRALGSDVWTYDVAHNTDACQCSHYRAGERLSRRSSDDESRADVDPDVLDDALDRYTPDQRALFGVVEPAFVAAERPLWVLGRELGFDARWVDRWSGAGVSPSDLRGMEIELVGEG